MGFGHFRAFAADAAEDGVDELFVGAKTPVMGHIHGRGDGGMSGGVQKNQLADAKPEKIVDAGCLPGQRLFQGKVDASVDLPQPSERGRRQDADEGPVAAVEPRERRVIPGGFVKPPFVPENGAQKIKRHHPGGGIGRGIRRGHGPVLALSDPFGQ